VLSPAAALGSAPTTFNLRAGALFYARVYRDPSTLFSRYSHDHVIQAAPAQSRIRFELAAPERCFAQLRIPVAALRVDEPSLRQRLAMAGTLDEGDRKSVREHLLAKDQLDAHRYPEIEILVQSCVESATSGQYLADVAVTIRGKTQRRARAVVIAFQDGRLRTRGALRFGHGDFGMTPYSGWLGAVSNLEAIDLAWSLEAEPTAEKPAP
jgi:polyisoprenoid-binding protein YceI